jgi:hypothetical protein
MDELGRTVAPAVSIVMPALNAARTVTEAVESVRHQTFRDWELIVVDDGSTDRTVERLAAIVDPRIRLVSAEHRGAAQARNVGMSHARGELLTFLDADDRWTPDKLERQVDALGASPDAGAVYSWTAFIDGRGRFLFRKDQCHAQGDVSDELLVTFFLASGSNVMVRRRCLESVGIFDGSAQPLEDWEFWLRVAQRWPFVRVPHYQVLYRFDIGSASSAVERYHAVAQAVAQRILDTASPDLRGRRGECLANLKQHACILYLTRTTAPEAKWRVLMWLMQSVGLHPRAAFSRRTLALAAVWLVLLPIPPRAVPRTALALLRLYGRFTTAVASEAGMHPELRSADRA